MKKIIAAMMVISAMATAGNYNMSGSTTSTTTQAPNGDYITIDPYAS